MNNLTITVVTPSYNQGQFLSETIESVIGQEGDFYLDYLIIDGGSTDDSVDIIRRYEKLLGENLREVKCRGIRYRWMSEKDQGQTDAIMKGFNLAESEILAWLNSDDTYLPGALQKVVEVFSNESAVSVIYGKTHFIDVSGQIIGTYPTKPFDGNLLPMFNFICQPATFFKKTAMLEVGGLNLSLHYVMDYDFWIRLAKKYRFFYLPEFFATYRLHEESKTISPNVALANHREALEAVLKYYNWAPLNRVYSYCYQILKTKFPEVKNYLVIFLALLMTPFKYLGLNRGVRVADLKMINLSNARKLSKNLLEIYKEY